MPARIPVLLSTHPYEVVVGNGILSRAGDLMKRVLPGTKAALITDSVVGPLYAETVRVSLEDAGIAVTEITVAAGEESKSLAQAGAICEQMIAAGLDRGSFVAALGGGVVGDLAGFVAGIYHRGIPYVQIPTTVVAQVDSSIGGKTGVNANGGKNLIGVFHQPALVIADPAVLATLPPREFNEGLAEVVKHATIHDAEMLAELDDLDHADLPSLVARNVKIKALIVADDEFETRGVRALLNFGHTVGHAVEKAAGYGRFLHGEAVSIGLAAALALSVEKAGLAPDDAERVVNILRAFDLPTRVPADLPTDTLMAALARDKKFERGEIRFVLTRKPGTAFVSRDVTAEDLRRVLDRLRE